jgi:NitT/TauT family transport system permease protein
MRRVAALGALPTGGLLAAVIGALTWEVAARAIEFRFLPPLSDVLARIGTLVERGDLVDALVTSLGNLAVGFTIAVVVGILVGLAMGMSRRVYAGLEMYVHAFLMAPSIVFAPVFFSMFGLGNEPVIAVIVMFALFKIVINTAEGVRTAPAELLDMAATFGASRRQRVRHVLLPSAAPLALAAIRIGAGSAVQGMVVAEMFIAVVGLGEIVMSAGRRFDAETVLATVVVLIVIAVVLMAAIRLVDRRLTGWLPSTARATGG